MLCTNRTGTERMELKIIGHAARHGYFARHREEKMRLDYGYNRNAWIQSDFFFDWRTKSDLYISRWPGRKFALPNDTFSSNGTASTSPGLKNSEVILLPPNTAASLKPSDVGPIAVMKSCYREEIYQRALDFENGGVWNIYDVDVFTAMRCMERMWYPLISFLIAIAGAKLQSFPKWYVVTRKISILVENRRWCHGTWSDDWWLNSFKQWIVCPLFLNLDITDRITAFMTEKEDLYSIVDGVLRKVEWFRKPKIFRK